MTDPAPAAFRLFAANLGQLATDLTSAKKDGAALVVLRIARVARATADELERGDPT